MHPLLRALPGRLSVLFVALSALVPPAPVAAQVTPGLFQSMPARLIGPAGMSGRIASVDVDLTDRSRIIVGTASGGVWRSLDGGVTWHPIFDDQDYLSIGDARISPANPDLIWVGTGEGNPRQSVSIGNGVYLSQDRGASWTHLGLENSERIHRVIPHPTNADIAYVASMGPLWNGGGERGVYRTRDRGRSWEQVLSVNDFTGAAELVMDPRNPDKLVAAMYEHRRYPWNLESGGVGSGIHITHDGGESWTKLGPEHGVPAGPFGRIGLAISASSPNVMYALIEATPSILLRSDDGGLNWGTVSDEPGISPRPMYYADIRVDPKNENRIYRLANNLDMSEDGGKTWRSLVPTNFIHGDHHALWIDPDDPRILVNGNDGGIGLSYDRGGKWRFVENLPLAQFYKITVDMAVPFNVYGGVQDSGSWMGPSTVWDDRGIVNAHWRRVNGADGFATMVDFSNPRFAYTTSQNGNLLRFDKVTMERRSIRPPAPAGTDLRWNWNSPLAVDAHDSTTIYFGSQHVHRSPDGGRTWEAISPDLTTNDAGKQDPTAVGAPPAMEYDNHTTLLAIDQSPVDAGVIWATSDDGKVQVTRDGGGTWTDTGSRLPGAPDSAYVPAVKASRHAAGRAYVVVDDHRRGDMRPYIYSTEDHGGRWEALSTNGLEGFLHAVEEDPVEPNLLFAGSELGLFVSLDRGQNWMKWTHGLPAAPIRGIVVHPRDHDLVVGTHGRAIWIVDDIRPLRALASDASIRERALHAFEAPPAQQHEVAMQGDAGILLGYRVVGHAMFFGESRPYGALLSYWVGPQAAGGTAQIQVRSADGRVIRDLEGSAANGINRVVWDLREPAPTPAAGGGGGGRGGQGAEVAPGTYQVTIRLGGQESTTTVQVLPDPRKEGVEFFITR